MKSLSWLLLVASVLATSSCLESRWDVEWEAFKREFGKTYKEGEETIRRQSWEKNLALILHHNQLADKGFFTFRAGMNDYSDLDHNEFVSKMNGYLPRNNAPSGSAWLPPSNADIPISIDWRNQGLVTPVKNQGYCGSCWAFSATGSLEGQHMKKTGKLVSLSEQNLMDCSVPEGNKGCDGGWMDQAFEYVKKNGGIDTEKSYPYQNWQQPKCYFNQSDMGATCSGYVDIPVGDEEALKQAVATVGPVSVAIDASRPSFQYYKNGVYNELMCGNTEDDLDHGVLVVGYGSNMGTDYWIVKNSWGASWGNNGYILMARNKNNQCGIASKASYPLV